MPFPKIVILARGGTHGDFLHQCCTLMNNNSTVSINDKGKVQNPSKLKMLKIYNNRIKENIADKDIENLKDIEFSHVWYDDFINWPSKFYYITYPDVLYPMTKKMYIEKACSNDKDVALQGLKDALTDPFVDRIKLTEFDKVYDLLTKTAIRKYKNQPGITPISMTDFYEYEKLVEVLIFMGVYNEQRSKELQHVYNDWTYKNQKYINEIKQILYK